MKKILSLFLVTALFVTMSTSAFAKEETDEVSTNDSHSIITEMEDPSYDWNAMVAGTLPAGGEILNLDPQEGKMIITRIEKPSYDWNAMVAGTLPAGGETFSFDPQQDKKIITKMEKPLNDSHSKIAEILPPEAETFDAKPQQDKVIIAKIANPLSIVIDNRIPCGDGDEMHKILYFRKNIHKISNNKTCSYMTAELAQCINCSYETETAPVFVSAHPRYDSFCPNYNGGPIVD